MDLKGGLLPIRIPLSRPIRMPLSRTPCHQALVQLPDHCDDGADGEVALCLTHSQLGHLPVDGGVPRGGQLRVVEKLG